MKSDDLTVRSAQALFDSILEPYPMLAFKLSSDARMLNNPHLEIIFLKLQNILSDALCSIKKFVV